MPETSTVQEIEVGWAVELLPRGTGINICIRKSSSEKFLTDHKERRGTVCDSEFHVTAIIRQ